MKIPSGKTLGIAASALLISSTVMGADQENFSPYVDSAGIISKPENFRLDWVHLGTWLVKNDEHASGPGVHDVYANPAAVKGFLATGKWPDGATLIKAISAIESKPMTTGTAQWAGETGVWFVMVKDTKNRFPDNAAWGEGWGWALFKSDAPTRNVTTNWKGEGLNNCHGCHLPAKATDWVYLEGYPILRPEK